MRVLGRAVLAAGSAALFAACGTSSSDQVHTTLTTFAHAVAAREAKPICDQVLAPALVERIEGVGLSCESAIARFFFSCKVRHPTLTVGRVSFRGGKASALVYAGAKGQPGGIFELGLVNTSRGWRVASESTEKGKGGTCA